MHKERIIFSIILILHISFLAASFTNEITPYKFTEQDIENGLPFYRIPAESIFKVNRPEVSAPPIVFYLSRPKQAEKIYPITIFCEGSSNRQNMRSVIHVHRYFLQEFMDLGCAVLTVEQWGAEGDRINVEEFMSHYTRSQRLKDHQAVIAHLKLNPPAGWNRKFIFAGVSEGGVIVTSLTEKYSEDTVATINLCGAGDWSWAEELWAYIQHMQEKGSCWLRFLSALCCCCVTSFFKDENSYQIHMQKIRQNPNSNEEFMGMTYLYHADALQYSTPDYTKIRTPFLTVGGTKDPAINSFDDFAKKAQNTGVKITYLRIENMDHYVRKRPDVLEKAFIWLQGVTFS